MKTRFVKIIFTLCLVAMFVLMLTCTNTAQADNGKREDGAGKYAQWTALWWQWILEQPATGNPNLDLTGADAANGQPLKNVFFLAGAFGGSVTRNITVPSGVGLFMPLVNEAGLTFPKPNPKPKSTTDQVPQLRKLYAAPPVDAVTELHATLDGVDVVKSVNPSDEDSVIAPAARVKSPAFNINSTDPEDLIGVGKYTLVSDGYWLYIPPLAPGTHVLNFGGAMTSADPPFAVDVTDYITVQ